MVQTKEEGIRESLQLNGKGFGDWVGGVILRRRAFNASDVLVCEVAKLYDSQPVPVHLAAHNAKQLALNARSQANRFEVTLMQTSNLTCSSGKSVQAVRRFKSCHAATQRKMQTFEASTSFVCDGSGWRWPDLCIPAA